MQMYTDFYLCIHLCYGVPALHRANSGASSQQVLKQSLSSSKVATDAATRVCRESG